MTIELFGGASRIMEIVGEDILLVHTTWDYYIYIQLVLYADDGHQLLLFTT